MVEMMDDPEYRRLMQKHRVEPELGQLEMVSESQRQEQIAHLRKAMMTIESNMKKERLGTCMNKTRMRMLINQMDVAEVYSPPRAVAMARRMGHRVGWSLDITTCDDDGREWDFNSAEMRNRAARKLLKDKPTVLVGSPMCGPFGITNNMNYSRMDPMFGQTTCGLRPKTFGILL